MRQGSSNVPEILLGIALAALTSVFLAILPHSWAMDAIANLLTLIAALYVGAMLRDRRPAAMALEIAGCAIFVAFALSGLWFSPWLFVAGFALHGGWDYLHHGPRLSGVVPGWYIPFCAAYDWAIALVVALFHTSS